MVRGRNFSFRNDSSGDAQPPHSSAAEAMTSSVTTTPTAPPAAAAGSESQNAVTAPMQTIIFENTNFKGRQQQHQPGNPSPMALNEKMGGYKSADLHMPIGQNSSFLFELYGRKCHFSVQAF